MDGAQEGGKALVVENDDDTRRRKALFWVVPVLAPGWWEGRNEEKCGISGVEERKRVGKIVDFLWFEKY